MRIHRILPFLLSLALFASCKSSQVAGDKAEAPASAQAQEEPAQFVLGQADEISVSVWRNSDLTKILPIDPSGNISMPLAGVIKAAGLTIPELRKKIADALAPHIVNPQVDIAIVSVKSARIHVLGEVRSPGSFFLDHSMQAIEAVSLAGGFLMSANEGKVMLVRSKGGEAKVMTLDLNMRRTQGWQNLTSQYLQSGDILYVLPNKITQVEQFMTHIKTVVSPFVTLEQGIVLWPQVVDAVKGETTSEKTPIAITP